jgi:hypothetical protein
MVKVDGPTKHDEGYAPDRLDEARKFAADYLDKAKFKNEAPAQRPNV